MVSIWRLKKLCFVEPVKSSSFGFQSIEVERKREKKKRKRQCKEWRCIDYCFWMIGYMCTTWWFLSLLYGCLPATLLSFEAPVSPGVRLSREGVTALHPVVLVPGIVTGGLELWEGRSCAEGLFRKRLWGDGFAQILKRPLCWLEHLSLHEETGVDPPGIRVRAVPGLVAADNFASGYLVWADLIENLARIGYEGKNLFMAAYDWRLSFQNTEIRDQALSRLKSNIELMFVTNGYKKVVVIPQSMGAIYFLHFLKWVETPPPMGGGGGPDWCNKYIKAIMNISPAFLGAPKAISDIFSTEGNVAFVRAVASGILNFDYLGRQTLDHVMRVCRTWDSIISLMPKGGETIWADLDWFPEQWNNCDQESSWGGNSATFNLSCETVWTDYDDMSRESIRKVTKKSSLYCKNSF
ncbi:putative phospholipid:diacylglycerol acyltransferase 2 [Spatholobus suberectus]|nr:putative phospholipid:diacylglycerol acyltransferase 2 [Spatholobus suberectus]